VLIRAAMPSLEHEALVDMFRDQPTLVVDLLRVLGVDIPAYATITFGDPALGQTKPTTLTADLVLELCDAVGRPLLSVILEAQLRPEDKKMATWPAYLTTHRERRGCDTCILVLTPSRDVAAWARRPIRLGPGNPEFRVLVLGPDEAPVITDSATAVANPTLAFISALTHGNDSDGPAVLSAALEALITIDKSTAKVYFHLLNKALSAPRRQLLGEMLMLPSELIADLPTPDFFKPLLALRATQEIFFNILEARKISVTPEQRKMVDRCRDRKLVQTWIVRAATANSAADVFHDLGDE